MVSGAITPTPQNDAEATFAPILKREDGQVDWSRPAREIYNRLRGFTPFPGCYSFLGGQRIEFVGVAPLDAEPDAAGFAPGSVCEIGRADFTIACGAGTRLRVEELQPAGKRPMRARDFLNGANLSLGMTFEASRP